MTQENANATVSLYVVQNGTGAFFAGYDADKGRANFVEDPREGKRRV